MDPGSYPLMIKASSLVEKLRATLGDGVDSALLLSSSGSLLSAVSGTRLDYAHSQECHMLVAVVANVWHAYSSSAGGMPIEPGAPTAAGADPTQQQQQQQQAGPGAHFNPAAAPETTDLEIVLLDLEVGKLCCVGLGGRHVLVLYAGSSAAEVGMMKMKAAQMNSDLYEALRLPPVHHHGSGYNNQSGYNSPVKSSPGGPQG